MVGFALLITLAFAYSLAALASPIPIEGTLILEGYDSLIAFCVLAALFGVITGVAVTALKAAYREIAGIACFGALLFLFGTMLGLGMVSPLFLVSIPTIEWVIGYLIGVAVTMHYWCIVPGDPHGGEAIPKIQSEPEIIGTNVIRLPTAQRKAA